MHYNFPVINTIDDVMSAYDMTSFYIAEKDGYQVINYRTPNIETFPALSDNDDRINAIRREFRGIIFDMNGKILRRPLHKFFNQGERSDIVFNFFEGHHILEKLDGSMIAPFIVDGRIIWGTKMGDTDVGKQAANYVYTSELGANYITLTKNLIAEGCTPIFEWCSRKQRIVLDYKQDQLILVAIRDMHTGVYWSYDTIKDAGDYWDIPVVKTVPHGIEAVRALQDEEGIVVRFQDGHMFKVKSEWYCQLHRVKEQIQKEKGVVELIMMGKTDDLRPLLPAEALDELNAFETVFTYALVRAEIDVINLIDSLRANDISRKGFALGLAKTLESWQTSCIFKTWESKNIEEDVDEFVKEYVLGHCNRNVKYESLRKTSLFTGVPVWKEILLDE